jgi:hypothetical protein
MPHVNAERAALFTRDAGVDIAGLPAILTGAERPSGRRHD